MKLFYKIPLSVFILGTAVKPVMAQETVDPEAEAKPQPAETPRSSRDNRTDKDLTLLVIPITLGWVLPTKYGVSATWISDATWSIEAEYLQASYGLGFWGVDMANLSEQHTSIHALYYPGN
ncbi:MAG: hypothetical protein M3Q07_21865, partial [Pseudobdellovibrionaceae bacterium]|nr:hypothetical protein [Pseudobdellovibrionaceae bacterium]